MPDWSYHTLFKPILERLPAQRARDLTLKAVWLLGAMPWGTQLIDFMGHMKPDSILSLEKCGIKFQSQVGLSAGICNSAASFKAFERFGFAFIELGPFTETPEPAKANAVEFEPQKERIIEDNLPVNNGIDSFITAFNSAGNISLPLFIRIAHKPASSAAAAAAELERIIQKLPVKPDAIMLDTRWCFSEWNESELQLYFQKVLSLETKFLLLIASDLDPDLLSRLQNAIGEDVPAGKFFAGFSIGGGIEDADKSKRVHSVAEKEPALKLVCSLKGKYPDKLLIASGGVMEPQDAIDFYEAGADLVAVYAGLVQSGPGLAKRINELRAGKLFANSEKQKEKGDELPYSVSSVLNAGWLGIALVGFGLIITGASAITVALTTVVLPYDESFLGLSRASLLQINPRLLSFMSHDRVTYAGGGMSCGLLLFGLSYFGARAGQKWADHAATASCACGFASFLLFLGFHYLDPLHALVTLMLLPLFIWSICKKTAAKPMSSSNCKNTRAWKRSLYGQFWFVCIGAGLILAGITICGVGVSSVFVKEDLEFMKTTANALLCHSDHLLPTIAHDRAGFGGTLVTSGVAVLLSALHGFRQGEGWVWWMLLISGLPGFLCALGIHYAIGYTTFIHLLPAYIATLMFIAGLYLSYPYLCLEAGPKQTDSVQAQ